jgi:Fuc2NAc and GlcNAc transferase
MLAEGQWSVWIWIGFAVTTLIASTLIVGAVRTAALRWSVLDVPNARSSHSAPTARGGGLGIVIAVLGALFALALGGVIGTALAAALAGAMILVAGVGAVDDLRSVSPLVRLGVHLFASALVVSAIGPVSAVAIGDHTLRLGALATPLTILYVCWWINLTNFMDGIDGIAGVEVACVAVSTAVAAWSHQSFDVFGVAIALGAASIGFLRWNWPPARIFMGDVGSGTVGLAIAALALLADRRGTLTWAGSTLLFGVFATDATLTLFRRVLAGKKPWEAHRTHVYQVLAPQRAQHRRVVISMLVINAALAAIVLSSDLRPSRAPLAYIAVAIGLLLLYVWGARRSRSAP